MVPKITILMNGLRENPLIMETMNYNDYEKVRVYPDKNSIALSNYFDKIFRQNIEY